MWFIRMEQSSAIWGMHADLYSWRGFFQRWNWNGKNLSSAFLLS